MSWNGLLKQAAAREALAARVTAILGRTRAESLTAKAKAGKVDPVAVLELGALSLSIGVSMNDDDLVYMARGVMASPINTGFYAQAMRVAKLADSANAAFRTFNASVSRMGPSMRRAIASPKAGKTINVVLDEVGREQPAPTATRTISASTRSWLLSEVL